MWGAFQLLPFPSSAAAAVLAVCNVLSEIVAEIRPACVVTAHDGRFAAEPMSRATGSGRTRNQRTQRENGIVYRAGY